MTEIDESEDLAGSVLNANALVSHTPDLPYAHINHASAWEWVHCQYIHFLFV
jgi:hypothetical protein